MKHDLRICACYHRPVNFGPDALSWMMAVGVCFIFEFICICAIKQGKIIGKIPSGLSHIIDSSGNKTAHNSILRYLFMLKNQIPLFVMRMMLELQFSSKETADKTLHSMTTRLSNDLSPFKPTDTVDMALVMEHTHLLDFLYHFIVPKTDISFPPHKIEDGEFGGEEEKKVMTVAEAFAEPTHMRKLVDIVWAMVSKLVRGPIALTKHVMFSKLMKVLVKLPWTILSKIPILKMLKEPIENVLQTLHNAKKDDGGDEESGSKKSDEKPPLLEEIAIPSVMQLAEAGV
ncbi:putative UPF0481 protein At3g02645 [Salvia miltiorrhiza]|uniref:putative UPF0481 protein At3g02645 n=1 Tax=Salvia miltiorrhiza TaxID=226208 RepID=UPI0025ACD6FA|nr:putative UPF0481 protein At3g02645 [Salvia miltiorrhiza]